MTIKCKRIGIKKYLIFVGCDNCSNFQQFSAGHYPAEFVQLNQNELGINADFCSFECLYFYLKERKLIPED